jgi:hypothetical protein
MLFQHTGEKNTMTTTTRLKKLTAILLAAVLLLALLPIGALPALAEEGEIETVLPDLGDLYMPEPISDANQSASSESYNEFNPLEWDTVPINGIEGFDVIPEGAELLPLATPKPTGGISTFSIGTASDPVGSVINIKNMDDNKTVVPTLNVTLAAIGSTCRVWVVSASEAYNTHSNSNAFLPTGTTPHTNATAIAEEFDDEIYPLVVNGTGAPTDFTTFQGFGVPLWIAGTAQKVNLILYDIENDGSSATTYTAGFFASSDYTDAGNGDTNLYIDIGQGYARFSAGAGTAGQTSFYGTVAHELQHLINFSHRSQNEQLAALNFAGGDPDDYTYLVGAAQYHHSANAVTTWLNEGLSGLVDVLYQRKNGFTMSTGHLYPFLRNAFGVDVGYVPTYREWHDVSSAEVLANYGSSSVLMQEFAIAHPDKADDLVSSPRMGYIYAKENVGGYYGMGFDEFFTLSMLNVLVDSTYTGTSDPDKLYTSAVMDNVWTTRGTGDMKPLALTASTSTAFNTAGRAYYTNTFLSAPIGAGNSAIKITLPTTLSAGAEYYIVTPYNQTSINTRSNWNASKKIAARLNAGENAVTVGTDNMFAIIAIAHDTAVNENFIYTVINSAVPISANTFTLTAPTAGATPVSTIIDITNQFTGTITWSPVDATFLADTVYTATITLAAESGYTLDGLAANFFTVDGAASVTNANGSNIVIVEFPKVGESVAAVLSPNPSVSYTFEPIQQFVFPTAKTVTISNTGNVATKPLTVALATGTAFGLSVTSLGSIAAGGNVTFDVAPKPFMDPNTYSDTITVTDGSGLTATLDVGIVVTTYDSTKPTVAVQSPTGTLATMEGENLVLAFSENVTAVAGKQITVSAQLRSFEYDSSGNPSPVALGSLGLGMTYTIPDPLPAGWDNTTTVTIPFSSIGSSPSLEIYNSYYANRTIHRAYSVYVETGAFKDLTGNEVALSGSYLPSPTRYKISGSFFSKILISPTVYAITPGNTATNISTDGSIAITFNRQLDKLNPGTVTLNPGNISLTGGTWSGGAAKVYSTDALETTFVDGNVYTVPYSSLSSSTEYTITISGFKDPDGNTMSANSSNKFTTEADATAPTVTAGSLATDNVLSDALTLDWTAASDDVTAVASLKYYVYQKSGGTFTVDGNGLPTDGTLLNAGGTAGIATYAVTGLTPLTTYWFNVVVEDEAGNRTAYTAVNETTVAPVAPTITTASLAGGTVGTAYSRTLAATGDAPITWSVTVGALPAGLALNAASGEISGTPTAAGASSFTVTATNGAGSGVKALGIIISAATPATYALAISANAGGTVSGTGGGSYMAGTPVSVTATPSGGYHFVDWTISGAAISGGSTANPAIFNMPAGAVTLTANFALDAATVTGVSVSPAAIQVQQGGTQQFAATVAGTNTAQAVTWSIEPGYSGPSSIGSGGLLTVALGETETTLTVRATSTADTSKYGEATVTVTTVPPAPAYSISLDTGGTHIFPAAIAGYPAQTAKTVTVTNTGNQTTGALAVVLSGTDASAFGLSTTTTPISDIAVGGTDTFAVNPVIGLAAGTYAATVTVSGSNSISEAFDVSFTVNPAALTGTASIDNTAPRIGDTLAGSLAGGNNTGTLTCTWKADGAQAQTGAGAAYTVQAADLGKTITLEITSDVESGSITSAPTAAVAKIAAPSAPGAPTLASKTHDSVTLAANAAYEYSKDGTTWQASNVFSGLAANTAYTFFQRARETSDTEASAASLAMNETTDAAPSAPTTTTPPTPSAPAYQFRDNVSRYTFGSGADLVFIVQKDFSLFSHVAVNGVTLTRGVHYKAESGSTVITLFGSYLQTLPVGTQTLVVAFSDDTSVTDDFVVAASDAGLISNPSRYAPSAGPSGTSIASGPSGAAATAASGAPRTGDDGNVDLWMLLLVLSVVGIVAIAGGVLIRRRSRMQ